MFRNMFPPAEFYTKENILELLFLLSYNLLYLAPLSAFLIVVTIADRQPQLLLPLAALVAAVGVFLAAWLVPQVREKAKDWGLLPSRTRARLFRAQSPCQGQRAWQLPWQWARWCSGLLLPRNTLCQPRRPAPSSPSPSAGDCTELLYPCRQALIQAMDTQTRSAWRLVNTQACMDVYESTRSLTWQHGLNTSAGPVPGPSTLRLPLFSKCQGLKKLQCRDVPSLPSLDTFPRGLQLEVLDLSNAEGITYLCRNFLPLTRCCTPDGRQTLKELHLSHIILRAAGAAALAPALKALTGLQRLDLVYSDLDSKCAAALAPALQALTGLQHLNLSRNFLCPDGLAALVPALHSLTGLQRLDIRNNYLRCLTAHYAKPLAPMLRALQLELQRNGLSAQGAATLVPALEAVARLQHLDNRRLDAWNQDLSSELGIKISAALLQALQLLHPQLQIMT